MQRISHLLLHPFQRLRRWKWVRWSSILLGGTPGPDETRVYYGHDRIPRPGEPIHGGMVKFQRMQPVFPNSPRCFNILYMGSSTMVGDWSQLRWLVRKKGARIVWNQNGVGYPGWYGPGWENVNAPMAEMLHSADYVFYQSHFCKLSADKFLGNRDAAWEILPNPVDTQVFRPAESDPDPEHLVLLSAGSIQAFYRFESAVRTLAILAQERSDVRLIVVGRLAWNPAGPDKALVEAHTLINELDVSDKVTLLPPYSQDEAPKVFRRAHILLHTQYNDSCPTTVLEAMASGLPIVYSSSGGVPELVGEQAGVGIPAELSWRQNLPPDPHALAEAVLHVAEYHDVYATAARQRAVDKFDLRPWIQKHRRVFQQLLQS